MNTVAITMLPMVIMAVTTGMPKACDECDGYDNDDEGDDRNEDRVR